MTDAGPRPTREDHYSAAGSWAQDRHAALLGSRRVAWIVAVAAMLVAVCEALALMALMPLKTVVPYTLLVDRHTGFVQALKPLEPQSVAADTALTQSFLVQYVIAREGFDIDTLQSDYRKVGLWSTGSARSDYLRKMQATNVESPLGRLPRSTVVDVEIKSVTGLDRDVAMVRYSTRRRDAGAIPATPQEWVSVIRHHYAGEPAALADRLVNPLGFQVTRYRRSAEAPPAGDGVPRPAVPAPVGF